MASPETATTPPDVLGLLDRPAAQGLMVPVIVGDAGYGRSVSFRLALGTRGWPYVTAVRSGRPGREESLWRA